MRTGVLTAAGTAACLLACSDPTLTPTASDAVPLLPSFSAGTQAGCPATADFVVSTEGQLVTALATASPGATIALAGMIGLTAEPNVTTPNITLTCATLGSGLFAQAGGSVLELLTISASGVAVDRLVLDGSNASDPYVAANVDNLRLTNTTVICGPASLGGSCGFFSGTPNAVVSGNGFRSTGSSTGLHMQLGIDGSRIENNTVTTTAPSTGPVFGGLRIRDGANVVIRNNSVQGPWVSGMALVDLASSSIEHNDLTGAALFGIRARSGFSFRPISMTNDVFRNNQISGAGSAGILLTSACGNQLFGNNLNGNAGDVGLVFDVPTGANIMVGNNNVVIDNGNFDCDGDGIADPNTVGGPGRVSHGVGFGLPPQDAGSSAGSRLR